MTDTTNITALVKELHDVNVFTRTECTQDERYKDHKNHPHEEFWCCEKCLQKKLNALADGLNQSEKLFKIAFSVLRNHEHLVRGECIEGCDMCEALKEIRLLRPDPKKQECPDHKDGHKFIQCDGCPPAVCTCGATEY